MTKEQLAAHLDGNDYRDEIGRELEKQAKEAGLVVVFGASDDLMEFRGAIYDEIGAGDETNAVIFKGKHGYDLCPAKREYIRDIEDDDAMLAALTAFKSGENQVKAQWCPTGFEGSWLITTRLPHATFDVMEDDELYCRGLVFSVNDLV